MLIGPAIAQPGNNKFLRTCFHVFESSRKRLLPASSSDCSHRLSAQLARVLFGILLCILIRPAVGIQPAAKNVLVLHNWAGLPESWTLMESTVRARVPGQINFYVASIENPRFDEEVYRESMAETLRRGYDKVKLDVVVAEIGRAHV